MNRRRFTQSLGAALLAAGHGRSNPAARSGPRTILFVDDRDVLYRSGTVREIHPLERHADNAVIRDREYPWEHLIGWNSVFRNPATGLYQHWYQAYSGKLAPSQIDQCVVCYATSEDGIKWSKPNLGLHSYGAIKDTNIVLKGAGGASVNYSNSVVFDPLDRDPVRRYKMAYWDFCRDENGKEFPGLAVAFSPDGIRWTKYTKAPLLKGAYGSRAIPVPFTDEPGREWNIPLSFSDAMDAIYDPKRGVFAIYHKMWIDGPDGGMAWKHGAGRTESKDFINWSKPELLLTPDDDDPDYLEFHTAPVFYYNDCYFGLFQILHRAIDNGIVNIELALSRDGLSWRRPFRKTPYLDRNPVGKTFDHGAILSNCSPVFLENEMRFYYGAYSGGVTGSSNHYGPMVTGIGFATAPRDRFACIKPKADIGQVTTRPFPLNAASRVTINANASKGGIQAELLNEDGRRIRGFSKDDSIVMRNNNLRHELRWKEAKLASLPPGNYMLRFHLIYGVNLYAMTIH